VSFTIGMVEDCEQFHRWSEADGTEMKPCPTCGGTGNRRTDGGVAP
jgi:hypothetical protein